VNRDLFPQEHSTSQARLWEDNVGTLRDADVPISGIHAPVAVNLLSRTPPTCCQSSRVEVDRLVAETSTPEGQADEELRP
jgi:hypothetical protein